MPGLIIPSYRTPAGVVLTAAYAYNAGLYFDVSKGTGRIVLNVHPDAATAAAGFPPADQLSLTLGQVVVPGDPAADPPRAEIRAVTLTELLAEAAESVITSTPPTGQDAYIILSVLFIREWLKHPALAGSTIQAT